jgi:sugar phosphate isomerase/epimerase
MKLGISSYAFAWAIGVSGYPKPSQPLKAKGLIEYTSSLGASVTQICDNLPLQDVSNRELEEIKKTAVENCISLEIGTRGITEKLLLRFLEIAKILNAALVRTVIPPDETDDSLEFAAENIVKCIGKYVEANVCLAIENYEKYDAHVLTSLIERIGSPNLGVCLDTVNSF